MKESISFQKKVSDYERKQTLGKGTYGIVFKAFDTVNDKTLAIKKVQKSSEQGTNISVMRQIGFLRKIQHPNIIKLEGFSFRESENYVYLIFEHIETDLSKIIHKQKISLRKIKILMKKLLAALAECHKHRYIHRDIKPANILVDPTMQVVKLADFGLVRQIHFPHRCMSLSISSLYYKSPQLLLKNSHYNFGIDMWGAGCVFAECVLGKLLFCCFDGAEVDQIHKILTKFGIETPLEIREKNLNNFKEIINTSEQKPIQEKVPELNILGEQGLDLLNKLLCLKLQGRISAQKALSHSYFSEIEEQ